MLFSFSGLVALVAGRYCINRCLNGAMVQPCINNVAWRQFSGVKHDRWRFARGVARNYCIATLQRGQRAQAVQCATSNRQPGAALLKVLAHGGSQTTCEGRAMLPAAGKARHWRGAIKARL